MTELTSTTTTPHHEDGRARRAGLRPLARHLLEMALAMLAGMLLLGPARGALAGAFGLAPASPGVGALLMATDMSVGMAVWMWYRGHSGPAIGEMTAAMYVPVLLLLVPFRAGLIDGDALLMGGHLLMLPAMLVAMLRRRDEYARHHASRPTPRQHPRVRALAHRWPTGLALLMTFGNWFSPLAPHPLALLVLPGGYLLIGAYRGRLGDRRVLAVQLAGLAGWTALALAAVALGGDAALWLVAAGWLAHAAWDAVHHRRNEVVPRGYAEFCGVLDAVVGVTVSLMILATP
ncbi:hypothetical protein AB0873_19580 [Micromonospora sp. NPDC047707]|uniref:hypothetical protein n=1 Tax=Micromonospora sp. NPDC047707 TaxID=3154498 RepID=UPI003455A138